MVKLKAKYNPKLFEMEGIGSQLDINEFSKKLFIKNTVSDSSVDSNSNVSDFIPATYINEVSKPVLKLNSIYVLWKTLRLLYNSEIAADIIERQLNGDIYINDFHGISSFQAYSYYGNSVIHLKDRQLKTYITMNSLFDKFSDMIEKLDDKDQINLTNRDIYILDGDKYVKLKYAIRHKTDKEIIKLETKNGYSTIVTSDHPVILADGTTKLAKDITYEDELKSSNNSLKLSNTLEINPLYAYFIGFLLGDGCITPERGTISIRQKNIETTEIYDVCKALFNDINISKNKEWLNIYNTPLANRLIPYLGKISYDKKLPDDILSWNRYSILSLISGLIDSDGTINKKNGCVDLRMNSFAVIQQVGELARSLGFKRVRTSLIKNYKQSGKSFKTNFDMYRVSFIPTREMIACSVKIRENEEIVFKKRAKDGRYETNKINKIIRTSLNKLSPDEYVYDITTDSGQFSCQGLIQHNCYNFSTMDIVNYGLPMITKIKTHRPKHLLAFKSLVEQFVSYASNSIMGATGTADLFVTMSWYVDNILKTKSDSGFTFKTDEDCWKYVKENVTSLIYTLNQPFRSGIQSAFTNISLFDEHFLLSMKDDYVFPDGSKANLATIVKLQEMFIDIMNEELDRTPITFPVTTACFATDKDGNILDRKFLKMISEKNLKYGFINIYCGKSSTLSSCCRLRSDKENPYFNSFGAGKSKIGSLGVVTLNMYRAAVKNSKNKDGFITEIKLLVEMAARINHAKRHIIKEKIIKGFLPLYTLKFMNIETQYSTVGLNGIYESLKVLDFDIMKEDGQVYLESVLDMINTECDKFQTKFDTPHNVEQVPAESSSVKIAEKDKLLGFNTHYDLYSNQFVPLVANADILDRVNIQGRFDKKFSGGAICHMNVENRITDYKKLERLIEYASKKGVIYFAINYNIAECSDGHITITKKEVCDCGEPIVNNFSRVVGFLTNTKLWNPVRREVDYPKRVWYK
jgi:ribonucleoside-triphosphate reductase